MNVDTQATTFKDAKGKYCFEDGRVLTLTAAAGSYDSKTKNLKLTDGVQASLSDIHARMPAREAGQGNHRRRVALWRVGGYSG